MKYERFFDIGWFREDIHVEYGFDDLNCPF